MVTVGHDAVPNNPVRALQKQDRTIVACWGREAGVPVLHPFEIVTLYA